MRKIQADAGRVLGPNTGFYNFAASASRAGLLLRADHRAHIEMAVRECGFRYLRFHGLYQDDMGTYREDAQGNPVYSWQYVDAVYDWLLDTGLKPILVFDFMPAALASGPETVYWEGANVTPPRDYAKWEALVSETLHHFTARYGCEELRQWLFEVWNEPDNPPFFTGGLAGYCKLYDVTARAVKAVDVAYRVGGPATAGNPDFMRGFLEYCAREDPPLDFYSSHSYAVQRADPAEEGDDWTPGIPVWRPGPSWPLGNQRYTPGAIAKAVEGVRSLVAAAGKPSLPLYYTEWGLTCDYWDPLRDAYQAPSYLLDELAPLWGKVDALSYCEISDVFEEDGPPTDHFHGGFGLVSLQGVRKPAYFAYWFLHRLAARRLYTNDTRAIACGDEAGGRVQVLFWDAARRQTGDNRAYYKTPPPAHSLGECELEVQGLASGSYRVQTYRVGWQQNDAYSRYLAMEQPGGSLSRGQVAQLAEAADGAPAQTRTLAAVGGAVRLALPLNENDVYLVTLEKTQS